MQLSQKLVKLRKCQGLTQLKLAEMMNVSRQAISRWEVGSAVPSTENLKYLSRLYDVPLEYLLHDDALEPVHTHPVHTHMELEREESKRVGRKKYITIVSLFVASVIFIASLFAIIFVNTEEKPVPMGNIEGSDMETVSDFELDW